MEVSYNKLQEYFEDKLPAPESVAEALTFHAYEVEEVKEEGGDYIFDIDVLPNRAPDSKDESGVAKELSAILNIPLGSKANSLNASDIAINISVSEINKLLGSSMSVKEVEDILRRLGFRYEISEEEFVVNPPIERSDLKLKADMIEEVGRIYGYENIEAVLPDKPEKAPKINKKFYYVNKVKNFLVKEGFLEVYTYTFRSGGEVEMIKPFASDKNFLRTDLRGGLADALQKNIRNRPLLDINEVKIFEIGNVFTKDKEFTSLGIAYSKDSDYLKDVISKLSEVLGVGGIDHNSLTDGHENVLVIGLDELIEKLPEPESEYEKIEAKEVVTYKSISPYPFMLRDIAVWVPADKTSDDVFHIIEKEAGELLANTRLFDSFPKDDKVSYAFNLVFQSQDKTLSDEEINKIMDSVTEALNSSSDWEVR